MSQPQLTANDLLAFAVVELGVQVPYEQLLKMSPTSELWKSMLETWKRKIDREERRNAMILCAISRTMGGNKTAKVSDFYTPLAEMNRTVIQNTVQDKVKAIFARYNATAQQ